MVHGETGWLDMARSAFTLTIRKHLRAQTMAAPGISIAQLTSPRNIHTFAWGETPSGAKN